MTLFDLGKCTLLLLLSLLLQGSTQPWAWLCSSSQPRGQQHSQPASPSPFFMVRKTISIIFKEKDIPGPSGAATTAMFLPTAGSAAAAQAAAVASVTQQQLQLQTAAATAAHINSINNVAASAQVIQGVTL